MKDLTRKAMLLGIGIYAVTREAAEKVVRELMKKGEANEEDVKRLAKELEAEAKKKQKKFTRLAEREADRLLEMVKKAANFREKGSKAKKGKKKR